MKLISRASVQWVGTLLVLFLPLVLLVFHLSSFWSVDAQYSYAWAVPLMAAFFFWEKWKTLPSDSTCMGKLLPLLGTCIAAVSLALAWLAHEAVPIGEPHYGPLVDGGLVTDCMCFLSPAGALLATVALRHYGG